MKTDRGLLYFAVRQQRYVRQAARSLETMRCICPKIPAVLFTDLPNYTKSLAHGFDQIVTVKAERPHSSRWGNALLQRISVLTESPFRKSLYLDSDTVVLSKRVLEVFEVLENWELVMPPCNQGNSTSARVLNDTILHCAVLGFRLTERVRQLFALWRMVMRNNLHIADPLNDIAVDARFRAAHESLLNDQTALAALLRPTHNPLQARLWVLEPSFVCDQANDQAAILHGKALKEHY